MKLTTKDRRALLMGGAAVVLAVILFRLLPWGVRRVRASAEELEARRELLARASAELAVPAALEDSAVVLRHGVVALAPRILAGSTSAEAMAQLSGQLNHLATAHQSRVLQVEARPDSTRAGDLRRLTIDATFEGDIRGVTAILAELTSGPVVLVPTRLVVTATNPAETNRPVEVLHLELTLVAWYLASPERV